MICCARRQSGEESKSKWEKTKRNGTVDDLPSVPASVALENRLPAGLDREEWDETKRSERIFLSFQYQPQLLPRKKLSRISWSAELSFFHGTDRKQIQSRMWQPLTKFRNTADGRRRSRCARSSMRISPVIAVIRSNFADLCLCRAYLYDRQTVCSQLVLNDRLTCS